MSGYDDSGTVEKARKGCFFVCFVSKAFFGIFLLSAAFFLFGKNENCQHYYFFFFWVSWLFKGQLIRRQHSKTCWVMNSPIKNI